MLMKPRWVSPRTGCSTLMTSAPQSARIAPGRGNEGELRNLEDANALHHLDQVDLSVVVFAYCNSYS